MQSFRSSIVADLITGYRINTSVSRFCVFPTTTRSGQTVCDESEAFVWVIGNEAARYLFFTGQLLGEHIEAECDLYGNGLYPTKSHYVSLLDGHTVTAALCASKLTFLREFKNFSAATLLFHNPRWAAMSATLCWVGRSSI